MVPAAAPASIVAPTMDRKTPAPRRTPVISISVARRLVARSFPVLPMAIPRMNTLPR
jgi:hypothetical protein